MLKNISKRSEGFTIIEVLIVLAIAGLILLVVFLAVPALQRNSRNTTIKSDVANVLGGISEFEGANSGCMPTSVAGTGTVNITSTVGSCGNATQAKVQGSTVVATAGGYPATPGSINIELGKTCAGNSSTRAVSAWYLIETANGPANQCQDS